MKGSRTTVGIMTALVVLLGTSPAFGVQVLDPEDTRGRLDLRSVRATIDETGILRVLIRTWDPWGNAVLAEDGPNRLVVDVDPDLDNRRNAWVFVLRPAKGGPLITRFCGPSHCVEG